MVRFSFVPAVFVALPIIAHAQELKFGPAPHPVVGTDAWVLIEIWPTVGDITLAAYFLDATSKKNQNLCEAAKISLDRDAASQAKAHDFTPTSYRQCLTVRDAIKAGYVADVAN